VKLNKASSSSTTHTPDSPPLHSSFILKSKYAKEAKFKPKKACLSRRCYNSTFSYFTYKFG